MTFATKGLAIALTALLSGCAASLSPYVASTPVWTADFNADATELSSCVVGRLLPHFGQGLALDGSDLAAPAITYRVGSFQASTLRFGAIAPGRTRVELMTDLLRSRRLSPEDVLTPIQVCASGLIRRHPVLRRRS